MSLEHSHYGAAKVAELLRQAGWAVSVTRVQRVRREDNLPAVRRRKFVVTTDSAHGFLVYPNLAQYMVLTVPGVVVKLESEALVRYAE